MLRRACAAAQALSDFFTVVNALALSLGSRLMVVYAASSMFPPAVVSSVGLGAQPCTALPLAREAVRPRGRRRAWGPLRGVHGRRFVTRHGGASLLGQIAQPTAAGTPLLYEVAVSRPAPASHPRAQWTRLSALPLDEGDCRTALARASSQKDAGRGRTRKEEDTR